MLEIRRYQPADHDEVWKLHVLGLQHVGAYLGAGPWDDDLHHIEDIYLRDRGEFLIRTIDERMMAMGAFRSRSDLLYCCHLCNTTCNDENHQRRPRDDR